MRPDLTKSQRRRIRELAGTAYDRELSRELGKLENDFERWRRGEIDAHELSDRIHRFHQGPNRRLFSIYNGGALEMSVAAAIARGTLTEEEATLEIVDLLRGSIEFARQHIDSEDTENLPESDSRSDTGD
jgi:hypothetical protein